MSLQKVKNALLTVGVPVNHYSAIKKPNRYIVWAEESQASAIWADECMVDQAIQGTIDYFTRTEYDANAEAIEQALNDTQISFALNSVQREDETGYIHHEWIFEVFADGDDSV